VGLAGRDLLLISDECYEPFVYRTERLSAARYADRAPGQVLAVGSFSKAYAMTGWRIGYGLGPKQLIEAMINLQSHSTSNANSIAQKAALAALQGGQESVGAMVAEFDARRRLALERLAAAPGLRCREPAGAFYLLVEVAELLAPGESDGQFAARLLEQRGVAVVGGASSGAPGFIRISYATSRELLRRGLDLLVEFAAQRYS
jgi:aspartate aminotransferase